MTKFEDNISPYLSFVEGSAPSSPAATNFKLYYDSADHLLKWKNSAGTVSTIATGAGTLLGLKVYDNATETFWVTSTTATMADVDATNAAVTFIAPASTNVLVRVSTGFANTNAGVDNYLGLRESTTNLAAQYYANPSAGGVGSIAMAFYVSGIAAGSHTYKFAWKTAAGTMKLYGGNGATGGGKFVMEVWAAP